MLKKLAIVFSSFGFLPRRSLLAIAGLPFYIRNLFIIFVKNRMKWRLSLFPILSDRFEQSGVATGHYFHQDLWAARRIFIKSPSQHIDVGSRVDGFVAHLLTFRQVTVIDVRNLHSQVTGLEFVQANMMDATKLPNIKCDSVSCLHAIEHFGLGRYGDPLDLDGWKKGLINLKSMLLDGGRLYLSVPVGAERIEFDAHRVFNPKTIIQAANDIDLELEDFSFIDDDGNFNQSTDPDSAGICNYGCGCFEFVLKNKFQQGHDS